MKFAIADRLLNATQFLALSHFPCCRRGSIRRAVELHRRLSHDSPFYTELTFFPKEIRNSLIQALLGGIASGDDHIQAATAVRRLTHHGGPACRHPQADRARCRHRRIGRHKHCLERRRVGHQGAA